MTATVAKGTFTCPICKANTPHTHTGAEVAKYREEQIARFQRLARPVEKKVTHYPGYGSSECWVTKIVWNNLLLEEFKSYSEYNAGWNGALVMAKWEAAHKKGSIERLSKGKPQAYPLCDICQKPMAEGYHSQYDFHACSEACREKGEYRWHVKHPNNCEHPSNRLNRVHNFGAGLVATHECWDCQTLMCPYPEGKQMVESYLRREREFNERYGRDS